MLEIADVLRQAAHRRQDQRPGELGRRHRRARTLSHSNTVLGTRCHIDMRADAPGLHYQFEFGQFFDQLARHVGALPDQHKHFGIFESDRQLPLAFDRVGVNLGLVRLQLGGALELAHYVLVII